MPMVTKLSKKLTYLERASPKYSHNPLNTRSHEVTWKIKNVGPMVTKRGKAVAYVKELSPIKLHDTINT